MYTPSSQLRLWLLLAGFAALSLSVRVAAEPPSRAARLSHVQGTVSFSPAGQPDWVRAVVNRPLTTGDRLWVAAGSRAELQVGGAAIRLGGATSLTLLNLDDRIVQLQLSEGTLKGRVRRIGADQAFEVATPNLAFSLTRAGEFRIDVDADDDATVVSVQSGRGEVFGEGASYSVNARQGYRFYGTGLSDYERVAARRDDDLDRWARERDRRADNSQSARYVSQDVIGYEDLDSHGTWHADPDYGNVWVPNRVAGGWTPYRDGHWSWIDPWGWTWVDDAPWGFAVSHYGRWASIRGAWAWVPGPPRERAVYAPALVVFVGAATAVISWFPLAPREVYRPSYAVSRGYFDNVNRSNAVIAPATITNVYNTTIVNTTTNVTNVVYANRQVTGAVVAVPAQVFAQSQPVARAIVPVSREVAVSAPVVPVAAVAPEQQSLRGGTRPAGARPPARERSVVVRTAPPAPPVSFAAQQQQLAVTPGRPIDAAQRKQLAAPARTVGVVTAAEAPAPSAPPPATAPAGKSPEARKPRAANRGDPARTDAPKAEATKAEAVNVDAAKREAARSEAARTDASKAEASRVDAAKAEADRADGARAQAARNDAAQAAATAKGEADRAASARSEAARANAAKADAARIDAGKAEAARAQAARNDAARAAAAKGEAARANAAKAEAARAEGARGDAAKGERSQAAREKAAAVRKDAAKKDDEKKKDDEARRR